MVQVGQGGPEVTRDGSAGLVGCMDQAAAVGGTAHTNVYPRCRDSGTVGISPLDPAGAASTLPASAAVLPSPAAAVPPPAAGGRGRVRG